MIHPIVVQMAPSPEQVPAVLARGHDVVMTAGAGTGKTRTLVARYLALLAEGCPLRGAIAITFTEKAAREMRNRVRDEVRRYLETDGLPVPERERWQDVYSGLDAARISTIHGLCAEILRGHPAEARIDPRFGVLDEGQGNLLRGRAVDETLAWAADDAALVPLFELLGERGFRDTLDTLLRNRLAADETFTRLPADVLAAWQTILVERQSAGLADVQADPVWMEAAATIRAAVANQPADLLEIQRRAAAAALRAADSADGLDARLAALGRLATLNLSGGKSTAWPGGKAQVTEIKAALKALRELWNGATLLQWVLTPLDEALAAAMPGLRACFDFAQARYTAFKRERQALDFDDLEAGALALLETQPVVRARWQAETAALLVDEFQDTNDRQRRLVHALNGDAGKLFIVGDAKQSIYRFRGADVTVFRAERERIARVGDAALSLDTSYRGHRELIAGLNDLLRPVLGEADDPARPWVEPFTGLRHQREEAAPGLRAPYVELHLALGSKADDGLVRAADALAARLAALLEGGTVQVEEAGALRPLGYGDIAILCRASTSFADYENALERAGIPFLTVAGRGFYGRPEVRDVLNALAALADPGDDLALTGLLRSPACALSDVDLYRLCEARDACAGPASLWQTLRRVGVAFSGEAGSRSARTAGLIHDLHARAGRTPVADLLKAFLDATGYRAALLAAGQARAARNVAKLLADAQASGLVGVGEFLAYVAELRDSGTREGEARAVAEGSVQIMSVHAAKGLEFPVVVLGDVTYNSPTRNSLLFDQDLGILLPQKDDDNALPAAYRLGKLTADDQKAAEADRLLYVAATRAREKLILSGCMTTKKEGTAGSLRGWLGRLNAACGLGLNEIQVAAAETGPDALQIGLTAGETALACAIYGADWSWEVRERVPAMAPETAMILPPRLLAPVAAEPVVTDGRLSEQAHDPGPRVWQVIPRVTRPQSPAWVVGKLVHAALAAWRFPDGGDYFARWARAQARSYGLTDARQWDDAKDKSRTLLLRFRSHPLYTEMAGAAQRLHEVPYSLLGTDGRVENGIIDALYLHEGRWTVVEFKIDAVPDDAALEQLLGRVDYLAQTERYTVAVERLLGRRPAAILCFLDCAGGIHLRRPDQA